MLLHFNFPLSNFKLRCSATRVTAFLERESHFTRVPQRKHEWWSNNNLKFLRLLHFEISLQTIMIITFYLREQQSFSHRFLFKKSLVTLDLCLVTSVSVSLHCRAVLLVGHVQITKAFQIAIASHGTVPHEL